MNRNDTYSTVRFGDMVQNINERILPEDAEGLFYVGLEHLDPESLKLRRWGTPDEVEAQKLRFYTGDIIFGKRRYYQKKLAVADFDGICSAHAMVLRAKPDVVLPEFLPFFMQSEMFFERAMSISVGSLSPTINWSALAKQEFPLPPLDEQHRIAEILWAVEDGINAYEDVVFDLKRLRRTIFNNTFADLIDISYESLDKLLVDTQYGISTAANTNGVGYPILRIPNVANGRVNLDDLKWVQLSDDELVRYSLKAEDLLIVRTNGNPEYVGRCTTVGSSIPENTVFASYLIRLRADQSKVIPDYLAELINSHIMRPKLMHDIRSSAGNYNINTQGIRKQKIPLLAMPDQEYFLSKLSAIDNRLDDVSDHIVQLKLLKQRFLEATFQIETDNELV